MARTFPKSGYDTVTGEWNDSLAGEFLWSNVNVSEAVPDVMTPSTWSLWWIFHYETNPIEFPGGIPFCGNIAGRPYFNLSLLFSMYQAIGRDPHKELQGEMLGSASEGIDIPILPFSAFLVYRTALPGTLKARGMMKRCQKDLARFLEVTPDWCRSTRSEIMNWNDPLSLLTSWQETLKPVFAHACDVLRTVTSRLAEPATHLRQELVPLIGSTDTNTILSNLSGASGDLASLGPLMGLAQAVQGRLSRDTYLERYGHRGPHEMELSAPGADDDPDWFEKQLAQFNRSPVDVEALLANQRAGQASAWASFASLFPKKVSAVRQQVEKVSVAAKNREAVRSEVTRLARLVRAFLLQAGAVTGLGDEVFFLSLDELSGVLAGEKTALNQISARREAYQKYCTLPPYPAMIIGRFDPFAWAEDPDRRSDFYDARQKGSTAVPMIIKGFAGATGYIEGTVRRIDRVEDAGQIQPGEILVTTITNVGWTPFFPRLAAIVTDVGAPLSHAAIVARELGIPAVVGCGNATMQLKTGDRVRVDGGTGIVEIIQG